MLEFLGDWGGFREAVSIVLSFFGFYFSSRLFKADLVKKLFKEEVVKNHSDQTFNLSGFHVIFEPIVANLVYLFACTACCRNMQISKNQHLLDIGQAKVEEELELANFLKLVENMQKNSNFKPKKLDYDAVKEVDQSNLEFES